MFETKDILQLRADFPILSREINGKPLVYFDNGASSQKPNLVIDRISKYYQTENSNIHRGVHKLSQDATFAYEEARRKIQNYINAPLEEEVIFTKGTTDGINLVANGFSRGVLQKGDEIIISEMEHHSNIVPWQIATDYVGAILKVIPVNDKGELILSEFKTLLNSKTKLVAITHVSNTLGTINPVKEIIELSHLNGTPVLLDGAQSVQHMKIDMQDLNCDFYALSGHKMFGPTGVGILYGKKKWLDKLPPYQGGGGMISEVMKDDITYASTPTKFEPGTMQTAEVVAFAESIKFIENLGIKNIEKHENEVLEYGIDKLKRNNSVKIIGNPTHRGSVMSFTIKGVHPHDIATILDDDGVAIRAGHHCCQILHETLGMAATARASLGIYNTKEDIDRLNSSINKCKKIFNLK